MPVTRLFRLTIVIEALLLLAYPVCSMIAFESLPRAIQELAEQQVMSDLDGTILLMGVGIVKIVLLLVALAGLAFYGRFAPWLWWAGLLLWVAEYFQAPFFAEPGWVALIGALGLAGAGTVSGLMRHPEIRGRFRDHSKTGLRRLKIAFAVAGVIALLAAGAGGWAIVKVLSTLPPSESSPVVDELPLHRESSTEEIVAQLDSLAESYLANSANAGIAIGVTRGRGTERAFAARGVLARKDNNLVTADTLFEIGSVSKVHTALLAAEAVADGVIRLDQPVSEVLGDAVQLPLLEGEPITFLDLATHHAGFPKMPGNLSLEKQFAPNPYADYSLDQLFAGVSSLSEIRNNGDPRRRRYRYSNLGFSLLAHSIAAAREESLADLHVDLFSRLGMVNTFFVVPETAQSRLATGHNRGFRSGHWHDGGALIQGAGNLVSSVSDQLTWLEAHIDPPAGDASFAEAVQLVSTAQRPTGKGGKQIGLGWQLTEAEAPIIWHNGATGGFRAITLWFPDPKLGVVVLGNSSDSAIDDIGFVLMRSLLQAPPNADEAVGDSETP